MSSVGGVPSGYENSFDPLYDIPSEERQAVIDENRRILEEHQRELEARARELELQRELFGNGAPDPYQVALDDLLNRTFSGGI